MNRQSLYLLANVVFGSLVVMGYVIHGDVGAHPLYLIPLFALCASPILDASALNGRHALLLLFSFDYFLMYGALDVQHLLLGLDSGSEVATMNRAEVMITLSEAAILLGAVLVQICYRLGCRWATSSDPRTEPKDWSEGTLVVGGIILWLICTRLNWEFTVHILVAPTAEATKKGLESLTPIEVMAFLIARMSQNLSIIIIAYAQCRYRRPYMIPLVIFVVLFQIYLGFVIDFKTEALIGGVLVVLTNLLYNARVPKVWVGLMVIVVAVAFPLLQANRAVRSDYGRNNAQVSENVWEEFERSLDAKDKVNAGRERAQTALERLTLKGSVELIVMETGVVAPFQNGFTLSPIVTAFIPRIIWPEKPSVESGRILNRDFHLSESADTYISPSHLGELYWNFGWPGIFVGMSLVGLLLGAVGARFDLSRAPTITRILVVVVTVRFLVIAAEGEIANAYVSWMRSMLGIGLMHLLLARVRVPFHSENSVVTTMGHPVGSRFQKTSPFAPL